ncbi:MAG: bifunctional metallophosphatase/5'-nucleotidase [Proteobacteria bacterium]|nr:bifunctional metallophosphatase/5'-nucleotidase [Desulfobacula sp.]MBU3950842.1 bifunctional metallophosphatase/5'-nucleotidase [Pseudomonadota bacterium]MBU4130724.1 bifunctional metallophosphatase/5'-nucleotidase [Pseudomonadota bacterium]
MLKKQIYIDMDDVVSKTTDTYAGIIEREFGKQASFEDIVAFDLRDSFGLTENEFRYFFDLVHQPEFLFSFEPVEGAVEALVDWARAGHCIEIVTGRPSSALEVSLAWLKKQGVPFDSFTMVDKYNRPGNDPRLAISKQEFSTRTYDLAVEDSLEMALFLDHTMGVKVALYDRPWNARDLVHEKVVRCVSWQDINQQVPSYHRVP